MKEREPSGRGRSESEAGKSGRPEPHASEVRAPGERVYALLLRLHPRSFRHRYEVELLTCYRDGWREEAAGRGIERALFFWWRMARGVGSTAWRQRTSRMLPLALRRWMSRPVSLRRRHHARATVPHRVDPSRRDHRSKEWRPGMGLLAATLDEVRQDGRYALRMLRRNTGFAAAVLLTLGLSIGAATAVHTVVDGVLYRPLPYPEPDRLYTVSQDGEDGSYWLSAPNYEDLKRELGGIAAMGAYSPDGANVVVEGEPGRVSLAEVDADFFRALGVVPAHGRTFTEAERAAGAAVVVISHGMWVQRFGGDRDVLGKTMVLDGRAREVIGVMPEGTMVPAEADVWAPIVYAAPEWRTRRGISWIRVLARLEAGADVATVRSRAAALSASLREAYPEENRRFEIGMRSLEEATLGPVRTQLRTLLAAVLLMLLVASINVGGLLLTRATARRAELAVRNALGGGPRRLASQLATEHAVLAVLGVLLGLAVGWAGVRALVAVAPPSTPRLADVSFSLSAFRFAAVAGLLAALLFGVAPAVTAFRGPIGGIRSARADDRWSRRSRAGLVASQVALALALLFGAGLLAKSFWRLQQVDLGFEAGGVLVAGMPIDDTDFGTAEARNAHYRAMLERAAALPGVRRAALTSAAPFTGFGVVFSYELPGVPDAEGVEKLSRFRIVTPELFETLGIPLVRGRTFATDELGGSEMPGAVVSEELTRQFFAGREPLGERIATAGDTFRIVGVAAAVRDVSLRAESPYPHVYVPVMPATRQSMMLVVRADGDPAALIEPLRTAVREVAPRQPLTPLRPMSELIADSVARDRFTLALLAFFAAASLLLAAVGLYGVLAYAVSRRQREIGVRVALGASAVRVRGMVVRQALLVVAVGIVAGLLLSLWGGRYVESLLFGVAARDAGVLAVVSVALLGAALLAAWIPARRAAGVAPVEALRVE